MTNTNSYNRTEQIVATIAFDLLGISDLKSGGHGALIGFLRLYHSGFLLARIEEALTAAYQVGVAEGKGPDSGVSACCGADIYSNGESCCSYCRQPCGKLTDTVV